MSISRHVEPGTPSGVLAEVTAAVRSLAETLWSARTDAELVDVVGAVSTLRSVLVAVEAGALVEADVRGLAKDTLAYGSTGEWLTHVAGLRKGEGKRRLVRAQALCGPMDRTRRALLDGVVSPTQVEVVVGAVEDLPAQDWTRRRGEKLMLRHAGCLDATDLARTGRHLVQVVDPDRADRRLEAALEREERTAHLGRYLSLTDDRAGGVRITGRGSAEDGALITAALLPLTCPVPAADDQTGEVVHDPRDHGARLWDALVATAQHALDTDLPPMTHGTRPRLLITLDHDTLKARLDGAGIGTTADGTDLPPGVLRRIACDADLVPAVLGTTREVLDVGRTRRLVTAALWTALVLRDRHCTFPACTRPPLMCHAHHLRHWADGGTTTLHNLALLCGHHHRVIHHTPWDIQLNTTDKRPEYRPPPKPGTTPEWIRYRPRKE
jgi:hypothetical protein